MKLQVVTAAILWSSHAIANRYSDAMGDDGSDTPDGFRGEMLLLQVILTFVALVTGVSLARSKYIATGWRVAWGIGSATYIALTWAQPEAAVILGGILLALLILAMLWPSSRRPPR